MKNSERFLASSISFANKEKIEKDLEYAYERLEHYEKKVEEERNPVWKAGFILVRNLWLNKIKDLHNQLNT